MLSHSRYQYIAFPIAHACGLACWSLLQPRESWGPILLWLIWLPVIRLMYSAKLLLLMIAGATPFLLVHVFYRG
jgi:hypothetical protein